MGPFLNTALQGKRILLTGGGTGLGKEIARGFAAHGAVVYICGRRLGVLTETAAELSRETGGVVIPIAANIRDPESVEEMVETAWKDGSTVMDGSFYVTLSVGKRWLAAGLPGSVVSNLVTWVWTGSAYVVPSAMAKTAIHAMTMSLAVEWGPMGIRLNAVAPGPFPTESAWEKLNPVGESPSGATSSEEVPLRRFGKIPELQNLMIFLMGDGCDYLTGQTIAIDGGHHLAAPSTFASLSKITPEEWAKTREKLRASAEAEKKQRAV